MKIIIFQSTRKKCKSFVCCCCCFLQWQKAKLLFEHLHQWIFPANMFLGASMQYIYMARVNTSKIQGVSKCLSPMMIRKLYSQSDLVLFGRRRSSFSFLSQDFVGILLYERKGGCMALNCKYCVTPALALSRRFLYHRKKEISIYLCGRWYG